MSGVQARRELMNRAIEEVRQRHVSTIASGQPIVTNAQGVDAAIVIADQE